MKECPYCKAQIADNARFCLYCMKPLTEKEIVPPQKKKNLWWIFPVAAVALTIAVILLLPDRKPTKPQMPSADTPGSTAATAQTEMPTTGPTADSVQESTGETAEPMDSTTSTESTVISATEMPAGSTGAIATKPKPGTKPATKGTEGTNAPATIPVTPGTKGTVGTGVTATTKPVNSFVSVPTTKPTGNTGTKPSTAATTEPTTKPATKPTDAPATVLTTKPTTTPSTKATTAPTSTPNTKPVTQTTTAPTTTPTEPVDVDSLPSKWWEDPDTYHDYRYRQAVQADVLGLDYQVTANDIVVTTIELWEGGYLQIPPYIEGKRVIALDSVTFPEGGPEHLELPETLLAIHRGVFIEPVYGPPRVYVNGEVLAVGDETETWREIYTSKTCVNQYGEKFSNYSRWVEWNG